MPSITTTTTPSRLISQMSSASPSYSTPSRALSPPMSSSSSHSTPTITPLGTHQKLNLVTRVAIEGSAKQNEDSVSVRVYLKMSVPLDSVTPGSTVQLFPEENVKILSSQVHPLDLNSAPYNFDSTVSPLLHRAARALKLPERSKHTFHQSVTGLSPTESSVVDTNYTGHILVSGYHISYVLPKGFPTPSDSIGTRRRTSISISERTPHAQFMAAIDMLVPYLAHPPRSPYLLSIPTPRCLHNNITLRIFPPNPNPNISSSFASLSSIENDNDGGAWDLTSEPHVTRALTSSSSYSSSTGSRSRSRANSNFADDESSDSSSVGFSYGCGIRGTFPSAERIRIRWARPIKSFDGLNDRDSILGRGRVGVKDVKGEMTCVVLGTVDTNLSNSNSGVGVVMHLSYKGTCRGVWFPGVATLLGMDVGLVAKNAEVFWVSDLASSSSSGLGFGYPTPISSSWQVSGGTGYTGFDVGDGGCIENQRHDSLDSIPGSGSGPPIVSIMPASPNGVGLGSISRQSSTSSLLRAPLPTTSNGANVAEYSFEGSPSPNAVTAPTAATTPAESSLSSLPASASISSLPAFTSTSLSQSRYASQFEELKKRERGPEHPITVHINMNELLLHGSVSGSGSSKPKNNTVFTFNVEGTVVVVPRSAAAHPNHVSLDDSSQRSSQSTINFTLPRFTVHAADSESISVVVKNDLSDDVEVHNSSSPTSSPSSSKGRTGSSMPIPLRKGAMTTIKGDHGGIRIAIKRSSSSVGGINGVSESRNKGQTLWPPTQFPGRPLTSGGSANSSRSSSPQPQINGFTTSRSRVNTLRKQYLSGSMVRQRSRMSRSRRDRDGAYATPVMIPWVSTVVTPLFPNFTADTNHKSTTTTQTGHLPQSYAVRLCLPAPVSSEMDSPPSGDVEEDGGEYLEFGLAKPGKSGLWSESRSGAGHSRPPRIDLVNVSLDGVPVQFESTAVSASPASVAPGGSGDTGPTSGSSSSSPSSSSQLLDLQREGGQGTKRRVHFGEASVGSNDWISWIKVHLAGVDRAGSGAMGGVVEVDYVVHLSTDEEGEKSVSSTGDGKAGMSAAIGKGAEKKGGKGNAGLWSMWKRNRKGKGKAQNDSEVLMNVYLPSFALPVGRLEVVVDDTPGVELSFLRTNLHHTPSSRTGAGTKEGPRIRLLHYSTEEFFYPHLSLLVRPDLLSGKRSSSSFSYKTLLYLLILNALAFLLLTQITQIYWQIHRLGKSMESYALFAGSEWNWNDVPEPVTVTMTRTVYSSDAVNTKWWVRESEEASAPGSDYPPTDRSPTSSSSSYLNTVTATASDTPVSKANSQRFTAAAPPKKTSSEFSNSLLPIQSTWMWETPQWQWNDLRAGAAEVMKKALRPAWRVFKVVWWGWGLD